MVHFGCHGVWFQAGNEISKSISVSKSNINFLFFVFKIQNLDVNKSTFPHLMSHNRHGTLIPIMAIEEIVSRIGFDYF
jgi:hypothetical protein